MKKINGDIILIRELQKKVAESQQAYKNLKGLTVRLVILLVVTVITLVYSINIIISIVK